MQSNGMEKMTMREDKKKKVVCTVVHRAVKAGKKNEHHITEQPEAGAAWGSAVWKMHVVCC